MSDPMLDALNAAAEAVRAANHAATKPQYPSDLYDRVGALVDILRKLEQLTGHLSDQAHQLAEFPPPGFRADDGGDPVQHARDAADFLRLPDGVSLAGANADIAHEALSHLATA